MNLRIRESGTIADDGMGLHIISLDEQNYEIKRLTDCIIFRSTASFIHLGAPQVIVQLESRRLRPIYPMQHCCLMFEHILSQLPLNNSHYMGKSRGYHSQPAVLRMEYRVVMIYRGVI